MYPFTTIAGWVVHGLIQAVLSWAPYINPLVESIWPPSWWYWVHSAADWYNNLDDNLRPTPRWIELYWEACWWHMANWTRLTAQDMIDFVDDSLRSLIGFVGRGFANMGDWVETIHDTLGEVLPSWAMDAIDGLWHLFYIFPIGIRWGWLAWSDIWEQIKADVRDWALNFYYNTVIWAQTTWQWLVGVGQAIENWWQNVNDFLSWFVQNPYGALAVLLGSAWNWLVSFWQNPVGYVLSWLDPWWPQLVAFAQDCLVFWYNLWGSHAQRLADILADPLGYLWDRAENFIDSKLGG